MNFLKSDRWTRTGFLFAFLLGSLPTNGEAGVTPLPALPPCYRMASKSSFLSLPPWRGWPKEVWQRLADSAQFKTISAEAIQAWAPYEPTQLQEDLAIYGRQDSQGNLGFNPGIFFELYYHQLQTQIRENPGLAGSFIYPTIQYTRRVEVDIVRRGRILVLPGIDEPPQHSIYTLDAPMIIPHADWATFMAHGYQLTDPRNWNHDVGHSLTLLRWPTYRLKLRRFYIVQAEQLQNGMGKQYWLAASQLVDESGQWISLSQAQVFETIVEQHLGHQNVKAALRTMSKTQRRKLIEALIEARPLMMTAHGGLARQISPSPNEALLGQFSDSLINALVAGEDPASVTGLSASLHQKLARLKHYLSVMDSDQGLKKLDEKLLIRSAAINRPLPHSVEVLEDLIDRELERFILGYRAYVKEGLDPEKMIDALLERKVEPGSPLYNYLSVVSPHLLKTLGAFRPSRFR